MDCLDGAIKNGLEGPCVVFPHSSAETQIRRPGMDNAAVMKHCMCAARAADSNAVTGRLHGPDETLASGSAPEALLAPSLAHR